jgi:hypothetical protein
MIEKSKNSSGISIKSELITHISFQSSEIMQSGVISFVTYWDLIVAFVCCCYDEVFFQVLEFSAIV